MTASVSDPDSTVKNVAFYLESNGTAGLQTGSGGDTLVGTATTGSSGNWSVNITSPGAVGTYTYYAVATDVSGIASSAGLGTCTVATSSILNPGFETPAVGSGSSGDYEFAPANAGWTFSGYSGVSGNGSMFTAGNPNAPEGTQVGFLEYDNCSDQPDHLDDPREPTNWVSMPPNVPTLRRARRILKYRSMARSSDSSRRVRPATSSF